MPRTEETKTLDDVIYEMRSIRRENRNLRWLSAMSVGLALFYIAVSVGWIRLPTVKAASSKDGILHVRGLIVEDDTRVERVRLGAPLPDPMAPMVCVIRGKGQSRE